MYRAFILFLLVSWSGLVSGQSVPAPRGCGYDHYVHSLEATYPGFRQAMAGVIERKTLLDENKDLTIYTIPVVVHVVWQEEAQNLPDSLIAQVMAVLNEDYRRMNEDAALIRTDFLDVVGDAGIEFELAAVERVETEAEFALNILAGTLPDNVKKTSSGGSDAWNPDEYLNIWVCNIKGGSLLGYAYPPADLANWPAGASAPSAELDGVVIHYEMFRRTGTYTATDLLGTNQITIPVRGRTITHEVGHYLGLRHIWGDGLLSILGIPDCMADDGMDDTPNQGVSSQFACNPEQNTCTDTQNDLPDMFENFMDYASEACLNSFTKQQIAVMRGVLENERSGLIGMPSATVMANAVEQRFDVFPNPVQAELTIQAREAGTVAYDVQLLNAQGQVMRVWQVAGSTLRVPMTGLPTGLYTLLLSEGARQYAQRLIID